MSEESSSGGDARGAGEWADESPQARVEKPFFTFWRCCGCLALVGVGFILASLLGAKWMRDHVFESTPIEVPELAVDPAQAQEIGERFGKAIAAGELVRITPRDLTIAIQYYLDTAAWLGPESRVHFVPTPEGLLDGRFRMQFLETPETPWFMRGRYVNVALVGNLTIEDGDITDAKLASYRIVGLYHGEDVAEEESKQVFEGLRQQSEMNPDLKATVDRVKLFRFDGEWIELQLTPE